MLYFYMYFELQLFKREKSGESYPSTCDNSIMYTEINNSSFKYSNKQFWWTGIYSMKLSVSVRNKTKVLNIRIMTYS